MEGEWKGSGGRVEGGDGSSISSAIIEENNLLD